jgi:hypothetical protein
MKKLATCLAIFALLVSAPAPAQDSGQSKDLYLAYAQSAKDKERRGRPGAQVRIELLRAGVRQFVPVTTTFRPGDKVKFHFAVNFPAYIAVTNLGSSGRLQLLFPYAGAAQPVAPTRDYVVPGRDDLWFEFDSREGKENLTFIFSRVRIQTPSAVPTAAAGSAGSVVVNPPTADAEQSALEELNARALSAGRDLNLVQVNDEEGYVLCPEATLSRPVGFTIKLKHGKS